MIGMSCVVRSRTAVSLLATRSTKNLRPNGRQLARVGSSSFVHSPQRRSFHYGTRAYESCFGQLPRPDTAWLRREALAYMDGGDGTSSGDSFDPQLWYDDPIVTLFNGEPLVDSDQAQDAVDTKNALGQVNGKQVLARPEQVERLKEHIRTYSSSWTDLRDKVRQMEEDIFTNHSGFLIGNQCVDFQKQDGITEIEEAIMANVVERRLNDMVLQEEAAGILNINRRPIFVAAVSNFTNFLDLSRKTLRSLEVGIPVVILGRTNNAQQHSFRWTQLLVKLAKKYEVDPGMITFLSCSLSDIKDVTTSCQEYTGNLYTTCSRALAEEIKRGYPNTVASTGGPNTLVVAAGKPSADDSTEGKEEKEGSFPPQVKTAIQQSATIESSGQCTALRHCVVPTSTTQEVVQHMFDGVTELEGGGAPEAVRASQFDGIFAGHEGSIAPPIKSDGKDGASYQRHAQADAYFRLSEDLPAPGIQEYWRKVTVDFTKLDPSTDPEHLDRLAAWLNANQPISLAINAPRLDAYKLALSLFDKTGMVVYTVGSTDTPSEGSDDKETTSMPPALTCQARPQEAECFGEFPPRSEIQRYTRFPVVVPSSNPSYDATYSKEFLASQKVSEYFGSSTKALLKEVKDDSVRGYCVALVNYLQDVDQQNPKRGFGVGAGARTVLWGLQRPPLGTKTYLRCPPEAMSWDAIAPMYTLFHVTTARDQIEISIDPANEVMISLVRDKLKLDQYHAVVIETEKEMAERLSANPAGVFSVERAAAEPMSAFPMVGQFTSLYFPLGHIKSTMRNDEEFLFRFQGFSKKWLSTLF